MRIRSYEAADLEVVVDLWYDAWHSIDPELRHPRSKPEWRSRWLDEIVPQHEIAVAELPPHIAGFAALRCASSELSQLFIAPSLQRTGVGSALLSWAKSRCPDGLYLYTLERNQGSRRFYERHGFRQSGAGVNAVNGHPTVRYQWMG
jgi:GNAT superfamily N-acetyltransferase